MRGETTNPVWYKGVSEHVIKSRRGLPTIRCHAVDDLLGTGKL